MSGTTLEVDRDAREIWNLAAIAIGTNDSEAAFDVCRKLARIEPHYRLALRTGADAPPEHRERATVRPGASKLRRFEAKFAQRCAKCARGIGIGTPIAYDPDTKRAFHEECAP